LLTVNVSVVQPQGSKMLVPGSNRRIFPVDKQTGMVVAGYSADGRQIVSRAREEAESYRNTYGHHILPTVLADRLSLYVHYFTIYGSLRPFGATSIIAGFDEDLNAPQLYMVEPSGATFRFFGCASGKGANAAKTELEKVLNKYGAGGISCRESVKEVARMSVFSPLILFFFYSIFFYFFSLQTIRDQSKEKALELEIGWLTAENDWNFCHVPKDLVLEADRLALAEIGIREESVSAGIEEKQEMEVVNI
jgi:20S proteasome subunit alpha 7